MEGLDPFNFESSSLFVPSYEINYDSCLRLLRIIGEYMNQRFRDQGVDYKKIIGLLVWNINIHQEKDSSYFKYDVGVANNLAALKSKDLQVSSLHHFIETFNIPIRKQKADD